MNKNWKQLLVNFAKDESGQDLIEYALVAGLIAVVMVATLQGVATAIEGVFGKVTTGLGKVT